CLQPIAQLDLSGADQRLHDAIEAADAEVRVRLFGTSGVDATRTSALHAAADDSDVVGQQRGGQGVADETGQRSIVKGEVQRARAVDTTASWQTSHSPTR